MAYEDWTRLEIAGRALEERGLAMKVLCASCKGGTVFRRKGRIDLMVHCRVLGELVPPDIAECTSYESIKQPELHEMNEIAIKVDKREGVNEGSYI